MTQTNEVLEFLEKTLKSESFDASINQGYLFQYLNIKYYLTTLENIANGVSSRGLVKLLFNTFKNKDKIFEDRISFFTFNTWFQKVKSKFESGKDTSFIYLDLQHKLNILENDKKDVAMATTKKVTKKTTNVKIKETVSSAPAPEKNFAADAASSGASADPVLSAYDPLSLLSKDNQKEDSIWDKIPKPELPLHFLDITGLEEHRLFDNQFVFQDYADISMKGENKGLLIDQKGFLFDPFTSRPGSKFYKPEDHYNMTDPLPIPINMIKPMLITDAITFQYLKPDLLNRPAPATMHSMDLQKYLVTDYRKTILTNEPDKIFYKL